MFNYIIEDYSQKWKKTKARNYYQARKEKYKKDRDSITETFLKMRKLKKEIILKYVRRRQIRKKGLYEKFVKSVHCVEELKKLFLINIFF